MKLQCKVCHEQPIVELVRDPNHSEDMVCCPNCDKQLAYATEKKYSTKLIWSPIDTGFNKDFGGSPVKIINL